MKLSLKRGDLLQLQVLKRAIQSGTPISGNRRVRARFVLALRRIIEDKYPARPNSRPRKDARNISLAVDFLIRCKRPRATKMAESRELSLECENYGIKISAAAIRKLPMRHPRAKTFAAELIERGEMHDRGEIIRDPHAAALREVCGYWLRAEAADKED